MERIIRRDFSEKQFDAVKAVLNEYGMERWERELSRVYLAALKLANGNLEELKAQVKMAKSDYRDVLGAAVYPERFRSAAFRELSVKEQQRIIDSDWTQYKISLER